MGEEIPVCTSLLLSASASAWILSASSSARIMWIFIFFLVLSSP
jgi:hypothetical protein